MRTKKINTKDMEKIVAMYHENKLSQSEIEMYENANGKPIQELIGIMEKQLELKKYSVSAMTITDARKLIAKQDAFSDSEMEKFEKVNQCSFAEVIKRVEEKVAEFEDRKKSRAMDKENYAKYAKYVSDIRNVFHIDVLEDLKRAVSMHFDSCRCISAKTGNGTVEADFLVGVPNYSEQSTIDTSLETDEEFNIFIELMCTHIAESVGKVISIMHDRKSADDYMFHLKVVIADRNCKK